ncbi:hypothetical protein THII_2401 [Thioploca ingrica]|uniref:Uncharacterized protein n=1 Tax=Thioploca ingrica TaxID=40754 RepID=A0A090AF49_9GAMM|nr:hypothetical protein THII_2401 [Thioploca ingrica]
MARKLEIDIKETTQELKQLLHQQKSGRTKERVPVLYLLKTKQTETALTAAAVIGRTYSTVKRWLRIYRQSGIDEFLKLKHGGEELYPYHQRFWKHSINVSNNLKNSRVTKRFKFGFKKPMESNCTTQHFMVSFIPV